MNSILQNTLVFTFILAMISGLYQNKDAYKEYKKLKRAEVNLQSKVTSLHEQINEMQTEIDSIRTSSIYAKKILTDKYHDTEDDEIIIFFDE